MDDRTPPRDVTAQARRLRRLILVTLVSVVGAFTELLAVIPPMLGFGVAVGIAIWWCLWLDRLSGPPDAWPEPSPDGGQRMAVETGTVALEPADGPAAVAARERAA